MEIRHLLPHLHYFWMVAKTKSFSLAAQQLHISQSAMSYQIKMLEEKLGITLFVRAAGQQIHLTREGQMLANECHTVFNHLEASVDSLSNTEICGRLNVTAPIYFGSLVLAPGLKYIKERYPKLEINAVITDQMQDYFDEGIDLGFRSQAPKKNLTGFLFAKLEMVLVGSEEYLANSHPINNVDDLKHHSFIFYNDLNLDWNRFKRIMPSQSLPEPTDITYVSSSFGIKEAILNGLGIGLLTAYSVEQDIIDGRLQRILPDIFTPLNDEAAFSLYVCYPQLTYQDKKIQAFLDTFKQYLEERFQHQLLCC